jgi:hypothetical protein
MAKVYKFSGYVVDVNEEYSESELKYVLEGNDLTIRHFKVDSADLGEWYDEHPLNYCKCNIAEFEKYFKG